MNFDNVLYNEITGQPYYISIVRTGLRVGKVIKHYGVTRYCIKCGIKFFAPNLYLRRKGAKFCSPFCSNSYHPTELNKRWKGGRRRNGKGYVRVMLPQYHPQADERGYVWEHRIVVESKLKRYLTKDEVLHHIDGNPANNKIENLEAMPKWDHMTMHRRMKREASI